MSKLCKIPWLFNTLEKYVSQFPKYPPQGHNIGPHKARNTKTTYKITLKHIHSDTPLCFFIFIYIIVKYRNRSTIAHKPTHTLSGQHHTYPSVKLLMTGLVICLLNETQKYLFTRRTFTCN